MRLTPHRKIILKTIKDEKNPLSAEMILLKLPQNLMDLSTIYRSLDILYQHELLSRCQIDNTTYYYLNEQKHSHYMICLTCKHLFEIDCHIHQMIHQIEKQNHFKITQHELTFYGYCKNCQ